MKRKGT